MTGASRQPAKIGASRQPSKIGACRQLRGERGTALLLAVVLVMLLTAVGSAAILASHAETLIAANFRQSREALYVAEGATARMMKDLTDLTDWSAALSGVATSTFIDGPADVEKNLPGGGRVVLCCGPASLTAGVQFRRTGGGDWGLDTPQWKLYGWGPASAWRTGDQIQSVFYTVVWVSDDAADGDGDPSADSNGTVVLYGLAIGPAGARRAVRAEVQRALGAEGQLLGVRLRSWRESRW